MSTGSMEAEVAKQQWRCPKCREPIGRIASSGDLFVLAPSVLIERTRTGALIHCRCGQRLSFNGGRVILAESVLAVRSIG